MASGERIDPRSERAPKENWIAEGGADIPIVEPENSGQKAPRSKPRIDPATLPKLPALRTGPIEDGALSPEETERCQRLIQEYEREAKALGDAPEAALLYLEIGRIWEEMLGKHKNAASFYQKAFNLSSNDPGVLHASRRLFTEVRNWNWAVHILRSEISAARDPRWKGALLAEMGGVLESKLDNPQEAEKSYREALEVSPGEPLAVHSLEQLLLARRDFKSLYELYTQEITETEELDRLLPLLVGAAQVAEDRLEDAASAIEHYRTILSHEPNNVLALGALRRLYVIGECWDELVDVLVRSAEVIANDAPNHAVAFLMAAAKVQHERLGAPDRALMSLLQALEHAPRDLVLLREIEWLYEQNEKFDEVVKVLRAELEIVSEPRERVPVLYRLGTIYDEQLNRAEEAIPVLEEAVELLPTYVPAMQALGRNYGRTSRWPQLAKLFERELEVEEDPNHRVSKLFKLSELYETRLDRADDAIQALHELLTIQPGYAPALKSLERLLKNRQRWAELVALYERELELTDDQDQRVFLLARIGHIAEEKVDNTEQALRAYERILEIKPEHLEAIRQLARLSERLGKWQDVLRAYDREVIATTDQNEVVAILHRMGLVQEEHLHDVAAAIASYEKVLTLSPSYLPALRSLGTLYHRESRWEDLKSMYEAELEVVKSAEHKVSLLFRIAKLHVEKLADDEGAVRVYEEILQRSPDSLPALKALGQVYVRRGEHEKLAQVLERESEWSKLPQEKAKALMAVAEIYEHKLDRADRAAEIYQEILRIGHSQETAVEALVRIYTSGGMWSQLSNALRSAAEIAVDPAQRAAILVRAAEIAGDKLSKPELAADHLDAALQLLPDNVTILRQLERVYASRKDWPKAIEISKKLASHETEPDVFVARQVRMANIRESELQPPQSGGENYLAALQRVPGHPAALRGLEIAYRRTRDWAGLIALYQREALLVSEPAHRANLLFRAGDLAEHRVKNHALADQLYKSTLELVKNHLPALLGRRRVAEATGDAQTALETLHREAEMVVDKDRKLAVLFESGVVYQERFGDLAKAIDAFRKTLQLVPTHVSAFDRLERVFTEQQSWMDLLELWTARAEALTEPSEQAAMLLKAANVAKDQLSSPQQAVQLYQEVLKREPKNEAALAKLGPLLFAASEWDEAIDIFNRVTEVSRDPSTLGLAHRSLGVIYQEHVEDLVKCVQALQSAIQAVPTDTQSLVRLAKVYREASDWASAINVLLRLAEVQKDAKDRVRTLLDLGLIYQRDVNDMKNAIVAHQKALELDPSNTDAILRLADLYEKDGNWTALADVSATYVRGLGAEDRGKAVPLHLKMAEVFEVKLNDDARATAELRSALEHEPSHSDALRELARIYAKSPNTFPMAVDIHRRILKLDPFRTDSYHEIRRMFEKRGEYDKAFVVCEILVYLNDCSKEEDLFYREYKDKVPPHPDPNLVLTRDEHEGRITHPDERGTARLLLETVAGELSKVFPSDLAPYEMNPRTDKHGVKSDLAMRKTANELAQVLGAPAFDLWVTQKYDLGFFLENQEPPALIVGAGVGRRIQDKELRFLLARELERIKGGHHLFRLPPEELESLVYTLARIANPQVPVPPSVDTRDMGARVTRAISRKAKKALEDLAPQVARVTFDVQKHRSASIHTANRAGLVLTNDIEVAVRAIAKHSAKIKSVFADLADAAAELRKSPEICELLSYAVSEEYFAARQKLGFSIQS